MADETSIDLASSLEIGAGAALAIVDVDEVIARFMEGFGRYIARQGYELRVERFALFQNIYRLSDQTSLPIDEGRRLFDDFFRDGADDLPVAEGARLALEQIAQVARIIILTNAPEHGRPSRTRWLQAHGFPYPLIINSGPKGPVVAALAARTLGPVAFVDDLLPNLDSVAEHAPAVSRFQMVADERLRPLAPARPDLHARHDDWPGLTMAILSRLTSD